jgi:hypothetical protein
LAKPFALEEELATKESRLALLNADLNIDGEGGFDVINDTEPHAETESEQLQDYRNDDEHDSVDDDPDKPEEPQRSAVYTVANNESQAGSCGDHNELSTGTYGKERPSILTDLEIMTKSAGSPAQDNAESYCANKSTEIGI